MGTKDQPSRFDCYDKAEPEEPLFTLLGRDPLAPPLVEAWAMMRELPSHLVVPFMKALVGLMSSFTELSGVKPGERLEAKLTEARRTAAAMRLWRVEHAPLAATKEKDARIVAE